MPTAEESNRDLRFLDEIAKSFPASRVYDDLSEEDEKSLQRLTDAGYIKRSGGGGCRITPQGQAILSSLDNPAPEVPIAITPETSKK